MYGTDTPLLAELIEETPQKVDDEQYRWKGIGRNHKAAVLHYVPEDRGYLHCRYERQLC